MLTCFCVKRGASEEYLLVRLDDDVDVDDDASVWIGDEEPDNDDVGEGGEL